MLQLADGLRIQQVIFAADAVLIVAADCEFGLGFGQRLEGVLVLHLRFARQHIEADAFDARCGAGEVVSRPAPCSGRWLRTPARRDSSAGSRCPSSRSLQQALVDGLDVVLQRMSGVIPAGR